MRFGGVPVPLGGGAHVRLGPETSASTGRDPFMLEGNPNSLRLEPCALRGGPVRFGEGAIGGLGDGGGPVHLGG